MGELSHYDACVEREQALWGSAIKESFDQADWGVLKPKSLFEKSHISQEQACLSFPCFMQSLAGTSSLEGWPQYQSLDGWSTASGANSQLITFPKADVRWRFHDLHNIFSQLLYLHKTKYCNKSLSFSWVNKWIILLHTHTNQILLQISENYCKSSAGTNKRFHKKN